MNSMKKTVWMYLTSIALLAFTSCQTQPKSVAKPSPSVDFSHGKLKVSENKRFLVFDDGTPFFYLGDTGWELFHRLDRKDAEKYLENRRSKGFTVIQAVALAELDGLNTPNRNGEKPLIDNNPLTPNEKYFQFVDTVIGIAREKGLFIGLLPTWGDKIDTLSWGKGPQIFNPENAFEYGKWIGSRYKDSINIIWIIGGDRSADGANFAVWDALANGIRSVDSSHLMTFHPIGGQSSAKWFHDSKWLDFNMTQTGHCSREYGIYQMIKDDYNRTPVKPCFDGEPRYEDHPVCWQPDSLGWFDEYDVRKAAYWSLFSGSFGHTYGCHPIWQMKTPQSEAIGFCRNNWTDVIDLPGSFQVGYARRLMESRDMLSRVPNQRFLVTPAGSMMDYVAATTGDGYAMVYLPVKKPVTVNLQQLNAAKIKAWWFNPRTGTSTEIIEMSAGYPQEFVPIGEGPDYVLVIDDVAKNYPAPGTLSTDTIK